MNEAKRRQIMKRFNTPASNDYLAGPFSKRSCAENFADKCIQENKIVYSEIEFIEMDKE